MATTGPATSTASSTPPTSLRRSVLNVIKGSAGNMIEWYDVYAYTVFITYFEHHFFSGDEENSTVYAYAVFAITFLMRPVGSWYFGRFADRRGRRAALTASVMLMAACSLVISLTPTMAVIGVWATVILVVMRLAQGFAAGGEYGTNATYMSEAAVADKRGFFSSFQYTTIILGHLGAQLTLLILVAVMPTEQIEDWGWRIPFFIGGVAAVVVWWARRTMDESLSQESIARVKQGVDHRSGTMRELLSRHGKALLIVIALGSGGTLSFYAYSVNGPAIIKDAYVDDPQLASWLNFAALSLLMVMIPFFGWLSDRIGRKPVYLFFCFGTLVYTYFLYTWLPQTTNPLMSLLILGIGFAFLAAYSALAAIIKAEFFPAGVRALGVGVSHAVANSLFGGTAPLIYAYLNGIDMAGAFIAYTTVLVAVTTVTAVLFLRNKGETYLDREQGHAFDAGGAQARHDANSDAM